jgi:hydroxymethylglutaryl-CoA reductase (NADPH)
MQRAPVFLFDNALEAREFGKWLNENIDSIRGVVKTSSHTARLTEIEQYIVANMLYSRFCYTTGDAAGQNMTGNATLLACEWIRANHPLKPRYILSGNTDTDKKHSMMNMIQTRGKRVVAEFVLKRDVAKELLRVDTEWLYRFRQIANVGTMQAGAAYAGPHSANGITAMFIATGQDVANVAESHAGLNYGELLDNGDFYWAVTLPALICATYGGGTGLPTQRECLEMMDCFGAGKADKLAEIIAAVVLAGDVSLSCAILAHEWVSSHEKMGRNR